MTSPDLNALLATDDTVKLGRHNLFPPKVAKERSEERSRRTASAQFRATKALRRLHADDWRSLYLQALAQLDAERGPLPGDEAAS